MNTNPTPRTEDELWTEYHMHLGIAAGTELSRSLMIRAGNDPLFDTDAQEMVDMVEERLVRAEATLYALGYDRLEAIDMVDTAFLVVLSGVRDGTINID
jgi:hypothetical protein